MKPLPDEDLQAIHRLTGDCWKEAAPTSLLITGGTGFFGVWLLESLALINRGLTTPISASILSREPAAFLKRFPHLSGVPGFSFIRGDVRDFASDKKHYDFIIHGATQASATMNREQPLEMYSTICDGTRHVLELANRSACRRLLFLSSGAVYGEQPSSLSHVTEDYQGAPDPLKSSSVYGQAKRMAENLCAIQAQKGGPAFSSARCFAFVGPHLPLDTHFAIGNFMADTLAGRDIHIKGDGTPLRSYLYASDLCVWLWTLLFRGNDGEAYNVGSEEAYSIQELAQLILEESGSRGTIRTALTPAKDKAPPRYVPSTAKAREVLGLKQQIPLREAVRKTLFWHRSLRDT